MTAPEHMISVLVVDGTLGALHRLGFPLPALASMQEAGVQLTRASWNVRKTAAGLSVSFFWPSSPTCDSAVAKCSKVSKSKKRRLRRQKCKTVMRGKPFVANSGMKIKEPGSLSDREEKSPTPPDQPYYLSSSPTSECESLTSLDPDSTAITLCHRDPELFISESQLSPSDIVPPSAVFYHEANDIDIDDCLSLYCQPRDGVPGFEIETQEDVLGSSCTPNSKAS